MRLGLWPHGHALDFRATSNRISAPMSDSDLLDVPCTSWFAGDGILSFALLVQTFQYSSTLFERKRCRPVGFQFFYDSRHRRRGSVSTLTPHQCQCVCGLKKSTHDVHIVTKIEGRLCFSPCCILSRSLSNNREAGSCSVSRYRSTVRCKIWSTSALSWHAILGTSITWLKGSFVYLDKVLLHCALQILVLAWRLGHFEKPTHPTDQRWNSLW